jgi:hypothetical protein
LLDHLASSLTPQLLSCRWRNDGAENLMLFAPQLEDDGTGRLVHCHYGSSGRLHVYACSTRPIESPVQLVTENNESIANAIVCWVWHSLK